MPSSAQSLPANVKRFIAFRILFNARFYYPVFAILFLDLGLSAEEFALINVVWAVTIIILEVPSGAIADLIGRKWMVVSAAILMGAEMGIIAFVPLGNHTLLLTILLLNRVLSGAAEAAASGADEALAYDSMAAVGRSSEWPAILQRLMRWQAAGFVITSLLGAVAYDADILSMAAQWVSSSATLLPETTLRFPLYLTLISAVALLPITLGMKEPTRDNHLAPKVTLRETNRQMLAAAQWIFTTPFALVLICAGVIFDSIIRLFLTFGASFYRLISIPEATFGLLGSVFAVLGFIVSGWGKAMVHRWPARWNLAVVALLTLLALIGIARATPYFGALILLPLGTAFFLNNFFLSHYLNQLVDSSHRATVLSFKGLAMNLAYAAVGIGFAGVLHQVKKNAPAGGETNLDLHAFSEAIQWLPAYFVIIMLLFIAFAWHQNRRKNG